MDLASHLVFGATGVQRGLLSPEQLAEAWTLWQLSEDPSLADHLVRRGLIPSSARDEILRAIGSHWLSSQVETLDVSSATVAHGTLRSSPSSPTNLTKDADSNPPDVVPDPEDWSLDDPPPPSKRYRFVALAGRGGIGRVWRVFDEHLRREVALKELRPDRLGTDSIRVRFLREARLTATLSHPGIVPILEMAEGVDGRKPFYTMRYLEGRTLAEAIAAFHRGARTPLERAELLTSFVAVCNALAYAHANGVIHRDIKGQNISLGRFGEVFILDWGMAKRLVDPEVSSPAQASDGEPNSDHSLRTLDGQYIGTPSYMSPEQASGELGLIDQRSDIYGLGAILYELLTGTPPYRGRNITEVLRKIRAMDPPAPRSIRVDCPFALQAICKKAMSRQRQDRYETATELGRDIQRWLADEPIEVYSDPLSTRARRWSRTHRTLVSAALAMGLTGIVALGIGLVGIRREQGRTETALGVAQSNLNVARDAVDAMLIPFADEGLAMVPGMTRARRELIHQAVLTYDYFLTQSDPTDLDLIRDASLAYRLVANLDRLTGDFVEADYHYQSAERLLRPLAKKSPRDQSALSLLMLDHAELLHTQGDFSDAEERFRDALFAADQAKIRDPDDRRDRYNLGLIRVGLAEVALDQGHLEEAASEIEKVLDEFEGLADSQATTLERLLHADALIISAKIANDSTQATQRLGTAMSLVQSILETDPNQRDAQFALIRAQGARGTLEEGGPNAILDEAIESLDGLLDKFEGVASYRSHQAKLLNARALRREHVGDHMGAVEDAHKVWTLLTQSSTPTTIPEELELMIARDRLKTGLPADEFLALVAAGRIQVESRLAGDPKSQTRIAVTQRMRAIFQDLDPPSP